jgi:hypothetical protein
MVFNYNLTALQLTSTASSKPIGTVVNWHDHPEVLGSSQNNISSDFPHYARQRLEDHYGGIAMYVSGTTGAQIGALHGTNVPLRDEAGQIVYDPAKKDADGHPFPVFAMNDNGDPRTPPFDKIRSMGFLVADTAIGALDQAQPTPSPKIALQASDVDIPFSNQTLALGFLAIEGAAKNHGYLKNPADQPIDADYCPDAAGGPTCVRISVVVATCGDLTFITSPGEPSPEYLLGRKASDVDYGPMWGVYHFPAMPRLLDYVKTRDTMMLDISNGYLGYLIPQSDYLMNDKHPNYYEELPSAGNLFGDTVGNKWLKMLGAPSSVTFNANAPLHP